MWDRYSVQCRTGNTTNPEHVTRRRSMFRNPPLTLLIIVIPGVILAQTTIWTHDIEYEIGGYYRMYDIPSPQGVIGLTGITGGPHTFDFSTGSTIDTLIFDYVETSDGGHGEDFADATIAEKKTEDSNLSWLYLSFEEDVGRTVYGFYDSVALPESPSVPFSSPVVDFPDSITYGTWFNGYTTFDVTSEDVDMTVDYSFTGFADAYGTIILPDDAGSYDCIQVNYSEQYVYTWMGIPLQTSYIRTFFYLTGEAGIAALITSQESENPVPNDFSVAQSFTRLYESSKLSIAPPAPVNLVITMVGSDMVLTWQPGTNQRDITYTVYSSTNPYESFESGVWTIEATGVSTTTWTDVGISEELKFYRVTSEE